MFKTNICFSRLKTDMHLSNAHFKGKWLPSVITAIKHFSILKLTHIISLMRVDKESVWQISQDDCVDSKSQAQKVAIHDLIVCNETMFHDPQPCVDQCNSFPLKLKPHCLLQKSFHSPCKWTIGKSLVLLTNWTYIHNGSGHLCSVGWSIREHSS